jgi:hypothetical protein
MTVPSRIIAFALAGTLALLAWAKGVRADDARPPASNATPSAGAPPEEAAMGPGSRVYRRRAAFEVNVLWPFVPGVFEVRVMIPVLRPDRQDWRGEIVTGAYADYANWVVRGDDSGKVRNLSGKLGYRQFLVEGLHVEVSANLGWRHEEHRPSSGSTVFPPDIDGFQTRLWLYAGYQLDFSRSVYANVRGALGVNLWRSDAYAYLEKEITGGADVNIGFRF